MAIVAAGPVVSLGEHRMVYCLQPSPENRPLSAKESLVFEESDPARRIITAVAASSGDALDNFGKTLGVTLSFHGDDPADYILFAHQHGVPLFFYEDGPPRRVRDVHVE
jgi:hypothetical protein